MNTQGEKVLREATHQLDAVLEYMVYASYPDFDEESRPFPEWVKMENLTFILDKLTKDGNVKQSQCGRDENNMRNMITFEGILFYQDGGYKAASKRKQIRRSIQQLKDWLLIVGSWIAAIAAVGVVVIELLKHFVWHR